MPDETEAEKVCHVCGADAPVTTCTQCGRVTCTDHMVFDVCDDCDAENEETDDEYVEDRGDDMHDEDAADT